MEGSLTSGTKLSIERICALTLGIHGGISASAGMTAGGDIVTNAGCFCFDVTSQPSLSLKQSGTVRATFFYDESDAKTKIARYSEAGGYVESPFAVARASGEIMLGRGLTVAGVRRCWPDGAAPLTRKASG